MNAERAVAIACALACLAGGVARAAEPNAEAAAEALFKEGKRLADAKSYAQACPKFEASQRASPAAGTLVNLADCYEHQGKIASAWVTYKEAVRAAEVRKRADWESLARSRAAALEPKIPKLVVGPAAGNERADLQITRDGQPVPKSEWGVPIPRDPGACAIAASAPGRRPFSKSVDLAADGKTIEVLVPALEAQSGEGDLPPPQPQAAKPDASNQKTIGLVLGGVGVVGIGVGAVTGLITLGKKSDAASGCTDYPNGCADPAAARSANDSAKSMATVSTISFIAGGLLLAAGGVLYFTAPKQMWGLRVAPIFVGSAGGAIVSGEL